MRARRSSRGQGMVEYALLLALVTAFVFVGIVAIAPRVSSVFQQLSPGLSPSSTSTALPSPATPAATHTNNGCGNNGAGNGGVGNCH